VKGFALLEVLIALLLLSISLTTVASLLLNAIRVNDQAYLRTQANVQLDNAIDYFLLHQDEMTLADRQTNWQQQVQSYLPQGAIAFNLNEGLYQIRVLWREREGMTLDVNCQLTSAQKQYLSCQQILAKAN
jgi:prepilin-type N-terminal cleavage/methylation domain-containing protein